jgi:hypothetical protein
LGVLPVTVLPVTDTEAVLAAATSVAFTASEHSSTQTVLLLELTIPLSDASVT